MPLLPHRLGQEWHPILTTRGKSDMPLLPRSGGKSGIQYSNAIIELGLQN